MTEKLKPHHTPAYRVAVLIILTALLLPGCSFGQMPTAVPTVDTKPTFQAVQTEAAKTVVAELTRSAPGKNPEAPTATLVAVTATEAAATEAAATQAPAAEATATVIPSFTPVTPSATSTRTLPPPPPAATATPVNTICTVKEQHPAFGDDFPKNADFDGKWVIRNDSSSTWAASAVDFKYINGTKFQTKVDAIDLSADVAEDASVTLIIDMRAPGTAGRYFTTWALVQSSTTLCTVTLTIDVKN